MRIFQIAAVLALSHISAQAAPITLDRLEASVNASLVLSSDVQKFKQTLPLRSQLDPLFSGTAVAAQGSKASHAEIVQFLIDERLIALQFPVSDSEVEQEINSIQSNNRVDRNGLRAAIKEQGFAFEDYFALIRSSVAKRNLIDRDIRTKVSISDDDIKNYFYNHYAKKSSAPMAYKVRLLSVSPSNYKSVGAARETIDRALKEVRAGEPFEEVAKRISDDPSRDTGGDLGTLTDDQMSPAIRETLKKLQIGQVSDVLGDPKSRFFVLKLLDVASGESDRLNRMKDEIRNQLVAAEYRHQVQLWLERQRQSAFVRKAGEPSVLSSASPQ